MLALFTQPWSAVPSCWIDCETTGVRPGVDRAVEVGLVRFEAGVSVGEFRSNVNPGIPIPEAASAIHGIKDADVVGAPSIAEVFALPEVAGLIEGANPAAYNASFDKNFVPPFGDSWAWPWLDSLSLVRVVDRFERGAGRHKLTAAAARHGIKLAAAHSAVHDARAAGELFYLLAARQFDAKSTLGNLLLWQRQQEAQSWFDFQSWLSRQPPKETAHAVG